MFIESTTLAGVLLVAAGAALRALAIHELKKAGVVTLKGGDFNFYCIHVPPNGWTASGIYAVLRHPCYVGSGLILAGVGIWALGWGGLVLAFAAAPFFKARAKEEEELRHRFAQKDRR